MIRARPSAIRVFIITDSTRFLVNQRRWSWPGGASVAADPLDVFTGVPMDLPGDLGNKDSGVVAGNVPFKPDLPSGFRSRESHVATAERQPQVVRAIGAHRTATIGVEDVQEAVPGDSWPTARAGGRPYQVLGHAKIISLSQKGIGRLLSRPDHSLAVVGDDSGTSPADFVHVNGVRSPMVEHEPDNPATRWPSPPPPA